MMLFDLNVIVEEKEGKCKVSWELIFCFIDIVMVKFDLDIQVKVDEFKKELFKEFDVVVGKLEVVFDSCCNMVCMQEMIMGNLIVDVLKEVIGVDVMIINGGGICGDK